MKALIFLFFLLNTITPFAQMMGDEDIDEDKISNWVTDKTEDYEGLYFFGFSEAESQLTISIHDSKVCAQLKSYDWNESNDPELVGWQAVYTNYTNVRIAGNRFYSDQSNGAFVSYRSNKSVINCLKLDTPPVQIGNEGDYELGEKAKKELSNYYVGNYINTIFEIIDETVLMKLSLAELQIMRNEVFARYGYIFKSGGKMEKHFQAQNWYAGTYKNVDDFITEIERANLDNIQKVEALKKG